MLAWYNLTNLETTEKHMQQINGTPVCLKTMSTCHYEGHALLG